MVKFPLMERDIPGSKLRVKPKGTEIPLTRPRVVNDREIALYRAAAAELGGMPVDIQRVGGGGAIVMWDHGTFETGPDTSVVVLRGLPEHLQVFDEALARLMRADENTES